MSTAYRADPLPNDGPDEPAVQLIALGGPGEIGLNMMLVESADDMIAVDCGLVFPDDEMPASTTSSPTSPLSPSDGWRSRVL